MGGRLADSGGARCVGDSATAPPVQPRRGAQGHGAARHAQRFGGEQPRHPRHLSPTHGRGDADRPHRLVRRGARRRAHARWGGAARARQGRARRRRGARGPRAAAGGDRRGRGRGRHASGRGGQGRARHQRQPHAARGGRRQMPRPHHAGVGGGEMRRADRARARAREHDRHARPARPAADTRLGAAATLQNSDHSRENGNPGPRAGSGTSGENPPTQPRGGAHGDMTNLQANGSNEEAPAMQRNGRVNSGDVSIFYRAFSARGRTPILLMHGANYFDSYDWVGVAEALAGDREVASFDKRGLGETGWSPSKDYSVDANMGDMLAVIAELKWERPIVVGHSASGRLSISFAANFPDKISRLVVVDSGLAREEGGGGRPTGGNPPLVFQTVEAARAHSAKLSNPPRISHARERALAALVKVEKGYMLKRDPDFQNTKPQGEGANLPQRASRDVWQELAAVKCPT